MKSSTAFIDWRSTSLLRACYACIHFLIITPAFAQEPIVPSQSGNTPPDERLFLLQLHRQLPNFFDLSGDDPKTTEEALGDWRQTLLYHATDIELRHLDDTLAVLYRKQIELVGALSTYFVKIGKIQREALTTQQENALASGYEAGFAGSTVGLEAYNNGSSRSEALGYAAAAGIITYLWDSHQRDKELDERQQSQMADANRDYEKSLSEYQAVCDIAAIRLSEKYGWAKHAAFPSPSPEEAKQIMAMYQSGNIPALLDVMDRSVKQSPANPFLVLGRAQLYVLANAGPDQLFALSDECTRATMHVPPSAVYDNYRTRALYIAADVAVNAVLRSQKGKSFLHGSSDNAGHALVCWERCLATCPNDPTGEIRERKAWMLMLTGKHEEALTLARSVESLRKDTSRYARNMTILYGAVQEPDSGFRWLERFIKSPGLNAKSIHQDPDFGPLAQANPRRFRSLLEVKWSWNIEYGLLNDDILLRNDSPFMLTRVTFRPVIRAGANTFAPKLKADVIAPGETFRWTNAVSIPGSKYDSTSVTLTTEQDIP